MHGMSFLELLTLPSRPLRGNVLFLPGNFKWGKGTRRDKAAQEFLRMHFKDILTAHKNTDAKMLLWSRNNEGIRVKGSTKKLKKYL